jgi:hypothetical protein
MVKQHQTGAVTGRQGPYSTGTEASDKHWNRQTRIRQYRYSTIRQGRYMSNRKAPEQTRTRK